MHRNQFHYGSTAQSSIRERTSFALQARSTHPATEGRLRHVPRPSFFGRGRRSHRSAGVPEMNKDLEELILAYEAVSQARDLNEEKLREHFEALLEKVLGNQQGLDRESLRKSIIRAHRQWALKLAKQPTTIPPKA